MQQQNMIVALFSHPLLFVAELVCENERKMYKMEEFLELRRNHEAHSFFYSHFVRCVVGKREWDMGVSYMQGDIQICTPSDEAYALVALENFYDLWMDIADKLIIAGLPPRKTKVKKGETRHPAYESDVPTKYTSPPVKSGACRKIGSELKEAGSKMILTWSEAGADRFNKHWEMVKRDRLNHPNFLPEWLQAEQSKKKKKSKGEGDSGEHHFILVMNDFDDEPEQVHQMRVAPMQHGSGDSSSDSNSDDDDSSQSETSVTEV